MIPEISSTLPALVKTAHEHERARSQSHQPPKVHDTLGVAPQPLKTNFTPSRPELPFEMRLIKTVNRARDVSQDSLHNTAKGLEIHQQELDDLTKKKLEKLREKCEQTQAAGVWETLRIIGAAILGAISAFFGLTLWGVGASTFVGAALIASGVLTVTNLAFTEFGIWNWIAEKLADDNEEKQKKIAAILPTVVTIVACGLGFAGMAAFGLWGDLSAVPKGLALLQTVGNVLTIGGTAAGKICQARIALSQAELHQLQHKLSEHNHYVERLTESLEQIMEQETQTQRLARTLLNLSTQTKQALLA